MATVPTLIPSKITALPTATVVNTVDLVPIVQGGVTKQAEVSLFPAGGGGGAPTNAEYVVMTANGTLTAERILAVSAELTRTDGGAGANVTLSITNNGVSDAKLRQGAALTVIGRSANSLGNVADIAAAAASGAVLREFGSTIGFGTIATAGIADAAVTFPKLLDASAISVLVGRGAAAGVGDFQEITLGAGMTMTGTVLSSSGGGGAPTDATYVVMSLNATLTNERTLAVGAELTLTDGGAGLNATLSVTAAGITSAMLRNSAALTVIGRSANSAGVPADIAAAAASGAVLRESGSVIGFGTIVAAGIASAAVTDAKISDRAAVSVFGRSANTSGVGADIAAGANGNVLRRSANVVGFGQVDLADGTNAVTGAAAIANGGTGQTTQTAAMDALSPSTTKGDLLVDNGTNVIRLAVGANTQVLTADSAEVSGIKWAAAGAASQSLTRSVKATNYTIVSGDRGLMLAAVAATGFTFTLPDSATVGAGWYCYVSNEMTGTLIADKRNAINRAGADTIDGLTSRVSYPGEVIVITTDGAGAFQAKILQGWFLEIPIADTGQTIAWPGGTWGGVHVQLWGGGGGGGSGRKGAAASSRVAGTGGGGGTYTEMYFNRANLGASHTITIAATAAGGAAQTVDSTDGSVGTNGNNSTFGTILTAYGGGGGGGGTAAARAGGSGGGALGAGAVGGAAARGGSPFQTAGTTGNDVGAFGGAGASTTNSGSGSGWGGGAGGNCGTTGAGNNGGGSVSGGPAGGAGGPISSGNVAGAGGDGGSQTGNAGGGGTGGAAGANGTAGVAGPTARGPGTAGGGGGAASGTVGAGGTGGIASGGGGGGAGIDATTNSGAGGVGGAGLCRVWLMP